MEFEPLLTLIKNVAAEQHYEVTNGQSKFQVYIDRINAVAFEIYANKSSGYIEVSQWEAGISQYGRGVYSLRNYSDVVNFCGIMMASASIRARRQNQHPS